MHAVIIDANVARIIKDDPVDISKKLLKKSNNY